MAEKPVALVTGVGPGTGAAILRRFASDGFRVIALARSPDLTSVLERKLPDTHAVQCDVSDEGQVRDTIAEIRDRFGSSSVLIHNAGVWGEPGALSATGESGPVQRFIGASRRPE
jgi:NAD(P)-dependent dehydrogenase (short-subunit alcohol dehydrogenase family)